MIPDKNLVIVIPFFRTSPLWYEEASIRQSISVLHKYDHVLVVPKGFDTSVVVGWYNELMKMVSVIEMDALHFESVNSYNKLMLSVIFYQRFARYSYMLIYQTDAWIFRNDLEVWMAKDFDYIGAPWINWPPTAWIVKGSSIWKRILWNLGKRSFNAVGNGGFSLRKTSIFIEVLKQQNRSAAEYQKNEDLFFSFYIPERHPHFRIPTVQEALGFSFDENPQQAFGLNKNRLPMACHAWPKYYDFWQRYITPK